MSIKCIDNFLSPEAFQELKDIFLSDNFPWYFNDRKVFAGDNMFQFTHGVYRDHQPHSDWYSKIPKELYVKLEVHLLIAFKANLTTRLHEKTLTHFHTDVITPNATTSILYMNTSNGCTHFKTGEKFESVENRLVSFPSHMEHAGSAHTDTKCRVVLNINYLTLGKL